VRVITLNLLKDLVKQARLHQAFRPGFLEVCSFGVSTGHDGHLRLHMPPTL